VKVTRGKSARPPRNARNQADGGLSAVAVDEFAKNAG
jgi:hypothetical protein